MPYELVEVRKSGGGVRRERFLFVSGITFWPAIAHLIEESGVIMDSDRKAALYQMMGARISLEESRKIATHLRELLRRSKRKSFVLPKRKVAQYCQSFTILSKKQRFSVYPMRIQEFIDFCEQVENGFSIR